MSVTKQLVCSLLLASMVHSLLPNEQIVKVYYTSVTGSHKIKTQQQEIEMVLACKRIAFEKIDIAVDETNKAKMREMVGHPALPPQIVSGDRYCGDFDAFERAIEEERLEEFLKC